MALLPVADISSMANKPASTEMPPPPRVALLSVRTTLTIPCRVPLSSSPLETVPRLNKPAPSPAWLLSNNQSLPLITPLVSLNTAPPAPSAELLENSTFVSCDVPAFHIAPPCCVALFPSKRESVRTSVPRLLMAPPFSGPVAPRN